MIHHSYSGHFAYRTGPWKLILAKGSGGWSSPKENEVPQGSLKAQLYDLDVDPGEQTNLYTSQPEVAARLLSQLKIEVSGGRSTNGATSKNDTSSIVLWKSGSPSEPADDRQNSNSKSSSTKKRKKK